MIILGKPKDIFYYLRFLLMTAGLGIIVAVILSLGPTLIDQFGTINDCANEQDSYLGGVITAVSNGLIIVTMVSIGGLIFFAGWRMRARIVSKWIGRDLIAVVSLLLCGVPAMLVLSAIQDAVCLINQEHIPSLAFRISPGYSAQSCVFSILADAFMMTFCYWANKRLHKG